jgi:hypothetical protein
MGVLRMTKGEPNSHIRISFYLSDFTDRNPSCNEH